MNSTRRSAARLGSAGESAAHFGYIGREAISQFSPVELGHARSLSHCFGEQFTHEMRQREPALGRHGVQTRREVAGETDRQMSVLAHDHFGGVGDGLAVCSSSHWIAFGFAITGPHFRVRLRA